VTIK
jgi:hypothetical protein